MHGKTSKETARRDLSYVRGLGAGLRGHRLLHDLRVFTVPIVGAIVLQSLVYLSLYLRTAPNWPAAATVLGVLAIVPIASAMALSAFRRHESPIIIAAVIVASCFSFAVSFLSALRIPVSFAGLAAAFPVTLLVMAIGNIRFHHRLSAHVALLAFDGDELPLSLLGKATRIDAPDADITAFDTLLIEPGQHHTPEWSSLLSRCYVCGVDIMPWTTFLEIRLGRVHVSSFEVSHLVYTPSQMLYARGKRALDLFAVLVTLPLTLPLAGLTALYIFLRDGAPVLFVQHRRGFGGRVFRMYKFRTMYKNTAGGATGDDDKRIIPGCRLIRKLRLDELPQLYNILIGDMSLIGPRPEAVDLVRWYRSEIPQWDYRMLVLPGITGWAQVNSGYTSNPEEARMKLAYDLYYIKHLSFDLDLQILFRTAMTVLLAKGAR
jgi:lipopolysaccharide/colanic/teichoic acid biosynthesis glycosyltransferase